MCGRYSQSKAQAILLSRFGIAVDESEPLAWPVIAPTESPGIVVADPSGIPGGRVLRPMRWGLLSPSFHDAGAPLLINARSETVFEKPAFRTAVKTRRVLVPADGFFEWRKEGKRSQPVLFRRPQGELFALAGLSSERVTKEGRVERSFAILTTSANGLVSPVHDRMPVVLHEDQEALWLNPELTDERDLAPLLGPAPEDALVSEDVPSERASVRPRAPGPAKAVIVKAVKQPSLFDEE